MGTEASDAVASLHEALLPRHLPVLPTLDVGATYLLAPADAACGDWFDVVTTPTEDVALVIGDVAGRGVEAVATMAQLSSLLRERLRTGAELGAALRAADDLASDLQTGNAATVCVVVIDPGSGRFEYCTVGHPPPLLVDGDGAARYLPHTGAAALGTRSETTVLPGDLRPGELLLLYTNGALHRSDARPDGASDLARAVAEAFTTVGAGHGVRACVDEVCERVLHHVAAAGATVDDVALLAAELVPSQRSLEIELPAARAASVDARSAVREWLEELAVRDLDATAALHTLGELVTNAAEHAYVDLAPGESHPITVRATLVAQGSVVLGVEDRGRWRTSRSGSPGWGLAMARSMSDHLQLERRPEGGTVATSRHSVARAVRMMRSRRLPDLRRTPLITTDEWSSRIAVHGPVDPSFVASLHDALVRFSHGGTVSVVLDLSDATYLCSGAVQLLMEVRSWAHGEVGVTVVVTEGCVAHQVLATLGLPYELP